MKTEKRLLEKFKPSRYELYIKIDQESLRFSGQVKIHGELASAGSEVRLHSSGLQIDSARLSQGPESIDLDITLNPDEQLLILNTDAKLSTKSMAIDIVFSGSITESMSGIYPSKPLNDPSETILVTQLESHHAREVFPCIDEPAAKAIFELSLRTKEGLNVLSNTPVAHAHKIEEDQVTEFEPTPIMSTYLLAFVIGKLSSRNGKTDRGTLINVWSTKDKLEATEFALSTAVRALQELESFFDYDYPLSKCDLVALPDFPSGAMENWGLITFREVALLFEPEHGAISDQRWITQVITHELAHQWFGNLVTMSWWTQLWLNEGFAQFMERYITDKLEPSWKSWEDFLARDLRAAQSLDSLVSSHAVEIEVDDPDKLLSIFDAVSYDKGSAIVRMLQRYIGEAAFKEGLRLYITKFAYGNATTTDLWSCLEEASDMPVKAIMSAWTSQVGFPCLSAELQNDGLRLSQRRFLMLEPKQPASSVWPIPVELNQQSQQLSTQQMSTNLDGPLGAPLNRDGSGFYITSYQPELLNQLLTSKLSEGDQISLLSDSFRLNQAGLGGLATALDLASRLSAEPSAAIWQVIIGGLTQIKRVIASGHPDLKRKLEARIYALIEPQLERLGWQERKSDSIDEQLMRQMLLTQAVSNNSDHVFELALKLFTEAQTLKDLLPHSRDAALLAGAKQGATAVDKLWSFYNDTSSAKARADLVYALTASTDQAAIDRNFGALKTDQVKLQDIHSWLSGMLGREHSRARAWQWMRDNWVYLSERFGSDVMSMIRSVQLLGYYLYSDEQLKQFETFFKDNQQKSLAPVIDQAREQISWKALWRERDQDVLSSWL